MCLNAVTRPQEELLPAYHYIRIHTEFEEYFLQYFNHPSHSWNLHTHTVNTHTREILGWKIIYRLLHALSNHLGEVNDDVQFDLSTLAFNIKEEIKYFHSSILRLQQEIILYEETVPPT